MNIIFKCWFTFQKCHLRKYPEYRIKNNNNLLKSVIIDGSFGIDTFKIMIVAIKLKTLRMKEGEDATLKKFIELKQQLKAKLFI